MTATSWRKVATEGMIRKLAKPRELLTRRVIALAPAALPGNP